MMIHTRFIWQLNTNLFTGANVMKHNRTRTTPAAVAKTLISNNYTVRQLWISEEVFDYKPMLITISDKYRYLLECCVHRYFPRYHV